MNRRPRDPIDSTMTEPTRTRVLTIRKRLAAELGRAPMSTEIIAEMGAGAPTQQRVRQILAAAGVQTYAIKPNKAMTKGPIGPARKPIERIVIANIRRLYKRELKSDSPRSDKQLSLDGGFSTDPVHAAGVFRRFFDGSREISLDSVAKFAALFGVDYRELFKPERGGKSATQ